MKNITEYLDYVNESKFTGKVTKNMLSEISKSLHELVGQKVNSNDFVTMKFNGDNAAPTGLEAKKRKEFEALVKDRFLYTIAPAAAEAMVLHSMPTQIGLTENDNKTFVLQSPSLSQDRAYKTYDLVYKYADETITFDVKAVTKLDNLKFSSEQQKQGTDYIIAVIYARTNGGETQIKSIKFIDNSNKAKSLIVPKSQSNNGVDA